MDRVNHPSHYEKDGHIECIDLLEMLVEGFSGIDAMEIGQAKYLFRAGSKNESGISKKEKSIEDVKKFRWYLNHLCNRISKTEELCHVFSKGASWDYVTSLIVSEFTFDKPDFMKKSYEKILTLIRNAEIPPSLLMARNEVDLLITKMEEKL